MSDSPIRATVHVPDRSEPVTVEVRVTDRIEARAEEDDRSFTIALDELKLEPGGFEADFVFCRPPDASFTIAVHDPRFVAALEAIADERLRGELRKVGVHRKRHARGKWIGIGVVVTAIALLGLAVAMVPRMLASSVDALPVSVDRQLGDAAITQVELAGGEVSAPVVRAFVDEIVARLAPHAAITRVAPLRDGIPTPANDAGVGLPSLRFAPLIEGVEFRVRVVESEDVNAFALPGGQIVVFTGLLRAASGPDEIAGVLGHEMAHVTLRHGLRNVAHRAGLMLGLSLLLGDASGWAELAGEAAVLAQSNDYSREQESAADAEGVRMLMAAGLDPSGLTDFFRLLEDQPGGELTGAMSWLSTHPDHRSRIAHVEALRQSLPAAPPRPLTTDWTAVRRALER